MAGDYVYKGDYVEWAVGDLLLADYRGSSFLVGVISAYAQQFQDLEDDLRDIIEQTLIPNAEGVQLDRIGKVIGQPRWDRTDADYRRLLVARIAANSSSGTPEAQIAVVEALFPTGTSIVWTRMGVCHFQLQYQLDPPSSAADREALLDLLLTSAPSGVGFSVTETDPTPSPAFQLDTSGAGWGQGYMNTEAPADA